MLFAWLLVLATDVLRRLGATIAWLLVVAVLYVELLVIIDRRIGQGHELVEHSEFKLQLYAVYHRFQRSLDFVDI